MSDAHALRSLALLGATYLLVFALDASAAQRTFVSTSGDDANGCLLMTPCRSFARAITQTDPAGEIIVLDSGGYGAVVVDKNVSIVSPAGVYAGIAVFGGEDGVLVSAPASKVVLRGLSINGQGGSYGVRVQAGEVHVENSVIANFGGAGAAGILIEGGTSVRIAGTVVRSNTEGMRVLPGAGTVSVLVRDSEFSNNATLGIRVSPSGAGNSALVTVERTSLTKSTGYGIYSGPVGGGTATVVVTQSVLSEHAIAGVASELTGATIWVRESAVTRNGTGLRQTGTSVLNACGANLLVANTTPTSGVINTGSCLDVASGSGTVTSVATGAGLTGGPITATGTINLAATNLLPTIACAANQVPQWNGSAWTCANGATGSVTSLSQGTGITLSANPITTTGSVAADTAYLQRRVSPGCAAGSSIRLVNPDGSVVCEVDDAGPANAFVLGGNNFGANAILGTNDDNPLTLKVNNSRVVRYEPDAISPNIIGGFLANSVTAGVRGATITGGGALANSDPDMGGEGPNRVTDHYGVVGGGHANLAGDDAGTVADARGATVAGGLANRARGSFGVVGGGAQNSANALGATVGGGTVSTANGQNSTVGGGNVNFAGGILATIAGGGNNIANGGGSAVGGGSNNAANSPYSTLAGGFNGFATGDYASIGGGEVNAASGSHATVCGGNQNAASNLEATVGGGGSNSAGGANATIGGGYSNTADGFYATVPGGAGNQASGDYSMAAGRSSTAGGHYAFAMGRRAQALNTGSFVFADSNDFDFSSGTVNRFYVRATGGMRVVTEIDGSGNTTWSCLATAGNAWACASDRNLKHSLVELDGRAVLAKLAQMPLYQWQPKGKNAHVKHFGPMAQDFHAAFGLGDDDKMIGMQDADGVALAAIQGLHAALLDRDATIRGQQSEIAELRDRVAQIESMRGDMVALKQAFAELQLGRGRMAARLRPVLGRRSDY